MSNRDDDDEDENDDYPRRFKSDYEADDAEFDASDDEPKRGPLAFAIALGILLVVSAVIWNLFTWKLKIPSSSSHALIGGIVGAVEHGVAVNPGRQPAPVGGVELHLFVAGAQILHQPVHILVG